MLARDRGHLTAERRSHETVCTQCGRVSPVTGGSVENVVIANMCYIRIGLKACVFREQICAEQLQHSLRSKHGKARRDGLMRMPCREVEV